MMTRIASSSLCFLLVALRCAAAAAAADSRYASEAQHQRSLWLFSGRRGRFSGAVSGLNLINTLTNTIVGAPLVNNTVIVVDSITGMTTPSFSIQAVTTGSGVRAVVFGQGANKSVRRETVAPYALCGNVGNKYNKCSSLGLGTHTITATPYSTRRARGNSKGSAYTVTFTIVQSKAPTVASPSAPKAPSVPVGTAPTPTTPTTPVAPSAPSAPSAAVAPSAPSAPVAPTAPKATPIATPVVAPAVAPAIAPAAPLAPASPRAPAAVVAPSAPVAPTAPTAPKAPTGGTDPKVPTAGNTAPIVAPSNSAPKTPVVTDPAPSAPKVSPTAAPKAPPTLAPKTPTTAPKTLTTAPKSSSPVTNAPKAAPTNAPKAPTKAPQKAPTKSPVSKAPTNPPLIKLDLMYTGNDGENSPVVMTIVPNIVNTIDLAAYNLPSANFSIRASPVDNSNTVQSVQFSNGQSETGTPWARCGNGGNVFKPCPDLVLNEPTVVGCTPYSLGGQQGTQFDSVAAVITIIDSRIAPTGSPVRSPTNKCAIPELKGTAWKPGRPYPLKLAEAQGMMIGDTFVIFGGFWEEWENVTSRTYTLDTSDLLATWQREDDIPISEGLTHGAHVQIGTKIYNCGGYVGSHPGVHTDRCIVYDLAAPLGQKWTEIAKLPSGRGGGGMFYNTERNAMYYVSGAQRYKTNGLQTQDFDDVWMYDFDTPALGWMPRQKLPYASNHMQAVTAKDGTGKERHFANGGQNKEDEPEGNYKEHYEYLPDEDKWVPRQFMPYARAHASSSTHGLGCGYVMFAGNTNGNLIISNVTYYSTETNSWYNLGNVPHELNTPICDVNRNTNTIYCETGRLWTSRSYTRQVLL